MGQSYEVPVFDPITQSRGMAEVQVKKKASRRVNGLKLDCFQLETRFRGLVYRSWATEDGEIVRQEIPPPFSVILNRESKEDARRGFVNR